MNIEKLKKLLDEGKSTNEIASIVGLKSGSTVRHWMKKYGLVSTAKKGKKRELTELELNEPNMRLCKKCGEHKELAKFRLRADRNNSPSSYCFDCERATSAKRASDVYATNKAALVEYMGGVCVGCDGKFPIAVYDFHHMKPEHKDFKLADTAYSFKDVLQELKKCILVCANCHQLAHHLMKQKDGYANKIYGNTELWASNKERKLKFTGKDKCDKCGYSDYAGALGIVFPEHLKHFRKYNKTHWEPEFESALKEASILCLNCTRTH